MRRLMFLLFAISIFARSLADIKEVELSSDNDNHYESPNHRSVAPTVNYDENNVWIKSKDLLPNVDIVIKDSANKVIYHGAMPLSPSASVIPLPDDNEKYSIELSYGKNSFSGFFE